MWLFFGDWSKKNKLPSSWFLPTIVKEKEIVFDATDLFMHFQHARLPSGIQRVQMEIIDALMSNFGKEKINVCVFSIKKKYWVKIPGDLVSEVFCNSRSGSSSKDITWKRSVNKIRVLLRFSEKIIFGKNVFLLSLGANWSIKNYYEALGNIKYCQNIIYIPFVHDLIPIIHPEFCVDSVVRDFSHWIKNLSDYADYYMVNSNSTRKDLIKYFHEIGDIVNPNCICTIPLNARRTTNVSPVGEVSIPQFLKTEPFVLLVSTIEPRKGHLVAVEAWEILLNIHGYKTPRLVFAGQRGWKSDDLYEKINKNPALKEKVLFLEGVTEIDLQEAYKNCICTIYPSYYEGWGLPITESLCYGKIPIVSRNSSLPEAAESFGILFDTGSSKQLADSVSSIVWNEKKRMRLENQIAMRFKSRSWTELGIQIIDFCRNIKNINDDKKTILLKNEDITLHEF